MIPTLKNIQEAQKIYHQVPSWEKIDDLLYNTFKQYPRNSDHDTVVFKIELVDSLYNCNLMMDKTKVADEVINLNLDLSSGDTINNVNKIAEIKLNTSTKRVGWVFSSKYCHFHRPEKYPICDKFAKKSMKHLIGKTYVYYDQYENYKKELDMLILKIKKDLSYKQMDVYLYLLGQWMDHKKGKKDISANIKRIIEIKPNLFKNLEP